MRILRIDIKISFHKLFGQGISVLPSSKHSFPSFSVFMEFRKPRGRTGRKHRHNNIVFNNLNIISPSLFSTKYSPEREPAVQRNPAWDSLFRSEEKRFFNTPLFNRPAKGKHTLFSFRPSLSEYETDNRNTVTEFLYQISARGAGISVSGKRFLPPEDSDIRRRDKRNNHFIIKILKKQKGENKRGYFRRDPTKRDSAEISRTGQRKAFTLSVPYRHPRRCCR